MGRIWTLTQNHIKIQLETQINDYKRLINLNDNKSKKQNKTDYIQ